MDMCENITKKYGNKLGEKLIEYKKESNDINNRTTTKNSSSIA